MTDPRPIEIKPHHLEKKAGIYERVSTIPQREESVGSLAYQRDQQEFALAYGWQPNQIDRYTGDLGVSATGRGPRLDWQRLLKEVANGEVGAVFSADYSRLSRAAGAFRTLLDLCRVNDTLLVIDGIVVDPNNPHDRFIAAIRAEFAEYENAHRAERMSKNRLAKAKEGYPVSRPPVGYISVQKGKGRHWVKDPNPQVRQRINEVYRQYERLGSIRKVLLWLKEHNLKLPSRARGSGELQWKKPSHIAIYGMLTNPVYCGVYRFGRTQCWPPGARGKARPVAQEKWIVKPGLHSGYFTQAFWHGIQKRLRSNRILDGSQPAGSGNALCQGRVTCGVCERRLQTRYPARRSQKSGRKKYVCLEASAQYGEPKCIQVDGEILDTLVTREVLAALAPPEVEALLIAADDENAAYTALQQRREEELERARSRADLLKGHLLQVLPSQRLTAAELRKDFDEALAQVQELKRRHRELPLTPSLRPTPEVIEEIRQLATDLPTLWTDGATTNDDRKRLIRLAIQEVRVVSVSPTGWEVDIVWAGGVVTRHSLIQTWAWRAMAHELAAQDLSPTAIAEELAIRGFKTRFGTLVTARQVRHLLHPTRWKTRQVEKQQVEELARQSAQSAAM